MCSLGTGGQQHRAYPEHRSTTGTTRTLSHQSCAKSKRPPRVTSPPERARRGRAEGHGSSCHRYKLQPHQRAAARGCAAPEPPQVPKPSPTLAPSTAVNRGEQPGWVLHQP